MKFQFAGFIALIFLSSPAASLNSQDRANDAIKRYKEAVNAANSNYSENIDGAQEKKQQALAAATQAALKALKDELAKTGIGQVARGIQLAKRIYQLDPKDNEARNILLAANIDLSKIKPIGLNAARPVKPPEEPVAEKQPARPPSEPST